MTNGDNIYLVATLKAHSGKAGELRQRLEEIIPAVRREPGCISYDLHSDRNDPDVLVMLETWESGAALDAHGNAPPFQSLQPHFEHLLAEPLTLQLLSRIA